MSRRAQEILLLIVRTLLLAFMVLAFSGPRWESRIVAAPGASSRQERILLIGPDSIHG